jgi:glycosyltransferase involved in cell wall biosynthesis
LRIVVNDYSGHPFQVELSRSLARRGHDVLHLHFADFQTPKGDLARKKDDPASFDVRGLSLGRPFAKNSYVRRIIQERQYGKLVARTASAFRPDAVIGCNNPLDAQRELQNTCIRNNIPFVFWLQDIYSVAIGHVMSRRLPILGSLIGRRYRMLERFLLRRSDAVIAITEDFLPIVKHWGVAETRCTVIPNWAPLDSISPSPKDNPWSLKHGFADKKVVLYSGTLGMKHDPALLVDLAEQLHPRENVMVLVISEGPAADWISGEGAKRDLKNLTVLPFQPFASFSQVLGAADIVLSLIEPEAGIFSVPSKVLSYLCAGKAMVLSVPKENLAARTVMRAGAGICVEPKDRRSFFAAVKDYLDNDQARIADGRRGRVYAETNFDIDRITEKFENVIRNVVKRLR